MEPSGDQDAARIAAELSAIMAGLLEDASLVAARATSAADALALRQIGEDVAVLALAMEILLRRSRRGG